MQNARISVKCGFTLNIAKFGFQSYFKVKTCLLIKIFCWNKHDSKFIYQTVNTRKTIIIYGKQFVLQTLCKKKHKNRYSLCTVFALRRSSKCSAYLQHITMYVYIRALCIGVHASTRQHQNIPQKLFFKLPFLVLHVIFFIVKMYIGTKNFNLYNNINKF